jgi:hypothetical protein
MQDGEMCTNVNDWCALDSVQSRGVIKCRGMMGKEH